MSETEQFFLCLRTISSFFSMSYLFVIFAHFVLIVGLFIGVRGLCVLEIPLLDMSFKLLLLIYPLMLLMVCFPVCHSKNRFSSCCEPGIMCPMYV